MVRCEFDTVLEAVDALSPPFSPLVLLYAGPISVACSRTLCCLWLRQIITGCFQFRRRNPVIIELAP